MLTLKNSYDKIENFKRTLYSSDSPTLEKMFVYLKRLINKRKLLPKRAKNFFQSVLKRSVSGSVKCLRLPPPPPHTRTQKCNTVWRRKSPSKEFLTK